MINWPIKLNSREIRFRAWHKLFDSIFDVETIEMSNGVINYIRGSNLTKQYQSDKDTLRDIIIMQSTGLLDKNGKEIYEGDIILANLGIAPGVHDSLGHWNPEHEIEYTKVVEWIDCGLSWKGSGAILCAANEKHFSVIGNIYENPELSKEPS